VPRRRVLAGALLAALTGVACDTPDASRDVAPAPAPAASPASPAAADVVITPDGIGPVRAGMSVARIRAALGPALRLGDVELAFMVDLMGIPVIRDADTLLYLVFPAHEDPDADAVPLLAITNHPSVQTPEGIGPGSTLAQAATAYGAPRLRFSADDEMREYATFFRYDHPGLWFRVAPGDTVFLAGRYPGGALAGYGETDEYDADARIMMVMVSLRRE
jgi:hypothetical protein